MPRKRIEEIWKAIQYNGVMWGGQISNLGNVKGITGKHRELQRDKDGYERVMLRRYFLDDAGKKTLQLCNAPVHRVVAENFLDQNVENRDCIIHLNGKIRDNIYTNLSYATRQKSRREYVKRVKESK